MPNNILKSLMGGSGSLTDLFKQLQEVGQGDSAFQAQAIKILLATLVSNINDRHASPAESAALILGSQALAETGGVDFEEWVHICIDINTLLPEDSTHIDEVIREVLGIIPITLH